MSMTNIIDVCHPNLQSNGGSAPIDRESTGSRSLTERLTVTATGAESTMSQPTGRESDAFSGGAVLHFEGK